MGETRRMGGKDRREREGDCGREMVGEYELTELTL